MTGNEAGMAHAYDGLVQDAGELGWATVDVAGDAAAVVIPGVPAGGTKVLRVADKAGDALRAADNVRDAARKLKQGRS